LKEGKERARVERCERYEFGSPVHAREERGRRSAIQGECQAWDEGSVGGTEREWAPARANKGPL